VLRGPGIAPSAAGCGGAWSRGGDGASGRVLGAQLAGAQRLFVFFVRSPGMNRIRTTWGSGTQAVLLLGV